MVCVDAEGTTNLLQFPSPLLCAMVETEGPNAVRPMTPISKRRWTRFALRTLCVMVTVGGCWLGWQLALDAAHAEDNPEVIALAQRKQTNSLHSQARIYHSRGAMSVAFSNDGKFLATGGEWGDIRVWDMGDWTCHQTIQQEGQICQLSFSPDDTVLSAISADGAHLTQHRFEWRSDVAVAQPEERGKKIAEPRYLKTSLLLTLDGKYRVTATKKYSTESFIHLQAVSTTGASRVVAEVQFPSVWDDTLNLAIAPDGGQVAIASGDVRLGIYSLPDLKMTKEFHFPCRARRGERISALAYSPDGEWLAAAQGMRPTPRLFRPETGEEVMPYEGHGDYPVDLRFLPDGTTLRSIGKDATVCIWDAATLKMLRRSSLPAGRLAASIRPSDGQYVLCPLSRDPKEPIQVIDLDTGKVMCEVKLPVMWDHFAASGFHVASAGPVYWLNDQEALCTGLFQGNDSETGVHWWRFNYRTGKIVSEGSGDNDMLNSIWFGKPELTEDGRYLFRIHGSGKGRWGTLRGERIDTATMMLQKLDKVKADREPNGNFGLVPGGKYFHIGSHIFDRQTLKLVAARDFPGYTLSTIAFSPDGARYAAVSAESHEFSWYKTHPSVVRVHETLTGKSLLAFSPSAAVSRLAFSADGQRVATANDDGTIEVRDVPFPSAQ